MGRGNYWRNDEKSFVRFENDNFDFRAGTRRSNGGVRGFASRLVCRGDFGSTEDKSSTQTSTESQVTVQGGGSGSATVAIGAGAQGNQFNVTSLDPAVLETASEEVNSVVSAGAEVVTQIESNAAQEQGISDQTIQYQSDVLATIAANAAPQTPAAQSEILSGTSPDPGITGTGTTGSQQKIENLVFIVAALASVYAFLRTRGRST
jgi:hypothetical protein